MDTLFRGSFRRLKLTFDSMTPARVRFRVELSLLMLLFHVFCPLLEISTPARVRSMEDASEQALVSIKSRLFLDSCFVSTEFSLKQLFRKLDSVLICSLAAVNVVQSDTNSSSLVIVVVETGGNFSTGHRFREQVKENSSIYQMLVATAIY